MCQFTPQRPGARAISDAERIHTEVEDQLASCQCHSQFSMIRVDDGKYKVMLAAVAEYYVLCISYFVFGRTLVLYVTVDINHVIIVIVPCQVYEKNVVF